MLIYRALKSVLLVQERNSVDLWSKPWERWNKVPLSREQLGAALRGRCPFPSSPSSFSRVHSPVKAQVIPLPPLSTHSAGVSILFVVLASCLYDERKARVYKSALHRFKFVSRGVFWGWSECSVRVKWWSESERNRGVCLDHWAVRGSAPPAVRASPDWA